MSNETFAAVVNNGVVVNMVVVEANSSLLPNNPDWIFIGTNPQGVAIGWLYDGTNFSPPPPPPPPPPLVET